MVGTAAATTTTGVSYLTVLPLFCAKINEVIFPPFAVPTTIVYKI